ncbi:YopX family protein [Vagococcus carniphilus]|uniref:YopX family protein n=1 Tax=Vagococcus carniphilus TaxID=218144 RepID=UPI00288EC52B|nr:YopX family protein [Vagococcus carniphilus]MDT2864662.1 YopX family protein [Vagococcus carniphilus]
MGEIKFRAWDKDREMFLEPSNLIVSNGDIFESFRDLEDGTPERNSVLIQYTGLKDKNGIEIYEGDIYRYKYWFNKNNFEYRYFAVCFETIDIPYEGVFHGYNLDTSYIEVAGNIYENPELLEVQNG